MSYDAMVLIGRSHVCVCGRTWYDSDGGPCHATCKKCGGEADPESVICEDCKDKGCDECGSRLDDNGKCSNIARHA